MKQTILLASAIMFASNASATENPKPIQLAETGQPTSVEAGASDQGLLFKPESVASEGSVNVGGARIDYRAMAGTIVVHPKGWDDTAWREHIAKGAGQADRDPGDSANPQAEAAMFYVAYFKKGALAPNRPITFLYNGGPGSSTVWLHMGAFGPRRVVTTDSSHTPAAPYRVVDNAYSLLDASDLVFIDAPGTGFSRIAGKDKEKAFYGVDADAYAFGEFIKDFLSRYGRWNSPKFLFGESYGTPRSAVVVNALETGDSVDFNGIILLSQTLNFELSPDGAQFNPGSDEAYVTALPTYAATAWYHNKIPGPRPADIASFLSEVERFADTEYALALQAGASLDPSRRRAIAEKLAGYIGLPADYILRSNLRINGGQFSKVLQQDAGLTTGRLDTRFSGPDQDPLSREAEYDPQSAAISSAYVSAFNDYARRTLGYGNGEAFRPEADVSHFWNFQHQPPSLSIQLPSTTNVMPDLASALKYNPQLRVLVTGGIYDLATPFYEGMYEMRHLPIPNELQNNIEYRYYESGHMVYANQPSLVRLHDDVASFITRTVASGR